MMGGGGEASFYSLRGRFPPSVHMETLATAFKRIRMIFPPKIGQPRRHPGSTDPGGWPTPSGASSAPLSPWLASMWALVTIVDDLRPVKAICSARWALFVSVTLGAILCVFLLRLLRVFLLFHPWVPKINDSPTLVEFVSNNSYHYC
jgi:hypothetical protein